MNLLYSVLLLASLISCSSTNSNSKSNNVVSSIKVDSEEFVQNIVVLDINGENTFPQWDLNGENILFQSRDRSRHATFQIYIYDLKYKEDKRITHQYGQAFHPKFNAEKNQITYSSTTDKEKENPKVILQAKNQYDENVYKYNILKPNNVIPADIYTSNIDGSNITRMTTSYKTAQFPQFKNDSSNILFADLNKDNQFQIKEITRFKKMLNNWKDISDLQLNFLFSEKEDVLCYVTKEQKLKCIETIENKELLKLDSFIEIHSFSFIENHSIIISAKEKPTQKFKLYYYKIKDSKCSETILKADRDFIFPTVHLASNKIAFSLENDQKFQIAIADLKLPECSTKVP